jgi:uncharacterized protein YndB with AHSA1/START domain
MVENKAGITVTTRPEERELIVERTFNAPRALVWQAWTHPEHLAQWWGPKGWTLLVCKVDFRPGGTWLYCMRGPDGQDSWGKTVYREIVEPERIVHTDIFVDADGNHVKGTPEMLITVEFAEQDGKTRITSRTQFASLDDLNAVLAIGVVQGITETWDRLENLLLEMSRN